MDLNGHLPHPDTRVMILSCPKSGNVWVRWLLHHAYKVPVVDIPMPWSDELAEKLPRTFVTHQHFPASVEIRDWMARNRVTVVTTIRHPADTLLSYFHFMKWGGNPTDAAKKMVLDGDRPGERTLEFVMGAFIGIYSISLDWARAGARVVRYESLLENPVRTLLALAEGIDPISEQRARDAAFLSSPGQLVSNGLDRRHIRTATSGRWRAELPTDIAQAMAYMSPYREACVAYGYDWDAHSSEAQPFDYGSVDPFRGKKLLDNGEPIASWMSRVYLLAAEGAKERWPDPSITAGDSFFNWLVSPAKTTATGQRRAGSLPNLLLALHALRADLQTAFSDPWGADRDRLLDWLFKHGIAEYQIAPGTMSALRSRLVLT